MTNAAAPSVDVALALVWRGERLLVARRPSGVHLGGRWEFPGGKRAPGESAEACAEREVLEETGVVARARRLRETISWDYPDRHVTLHPVDCDWIEGEGVAREVAEVCWVKPADLVFFDFPEANASLIAALLQSTQPR